MAKQVLIAGGTGLVGSRLTKLLIKNGYQVKILTRKPVEQKDSNPSYFEWDPDNGTIDKEAIQQVSCVINLAGRNIYERRWSQSFKKAMYDSRILSTRLLVDQIGRSKDKPVLINASALNYYGKDREGVLREDDHPGDDFLGKLCLDWEKEVFKAEKHHVRTVVLRFAIVLSSRGGALEEMVRPVRLWAGTPLGSGNQYFSWIHIDDLSQMILHAMENNNVQGVYNAVSDSPVINKELMKAIAKELNKPMFLPPVPSFALRIALGELADYMTGSINLSNEKIRSTGFKCTFPDIDTAIKDLLSRQ
jgi:uncharacterized protein